ncbi:MAG: hypothetical protein KGL59_04085 [Acidobacteriota bacterium]|nr:hypothetical protein [Acidobacteriota bacterium]
MRKRGILLAVAALAAAGVMSACSGTSATANTSLSNGTVVVLGSDYPTLANVVSFQVPISGITVSGNGKTDVPVVDTPATIDFSRLVGLQALIDVKPIAPGTYTSATITFGGNPTLAVLNTTVTPPAVTTLSAQFSSMTTTVTFAQPLNVGESQVMGLLLDFRIGKSIPVDSTGNIVSTNGVVTVTPYIRFRFIDPQQAKMEVDDLRGGVMSIGSNGTFVMQGPGGRQFTVETDSSTQWEPSTQNFSTLATSDIVNVEEAVIDPATLQVKAKEIDVIPDKFLLTGLVTYVNPLATSTQSTCAPTVDVLVRSAIPGTTGSTFAQGQIASIALTGSETYWVGHGNWIGSVFNTNFGSCTLVPGQAIAIAGSLDSTGTVLTPKHVVLGLQGFAGTAASTVGTDGTFTFNPLGLAGTLLPNPVTVQTISTSIFTTELENLTGLSSINSGTTLHIAGLVLYNTSTNTTEIVAGRIVTPEN